MVLLVKYFIYQNQTSTQQGYTIFIDVFSNDVTAVKRNKRWLTFRKSYSTTPGGGIGGNVHKSFKDLIISKPYGAFGSCLAVYSQRRLRSAWASAQSDQSLCCVLNG